MLVIYIAHPLQGDGSLEWGVQSKNVERYLHFAARAVNEGHAVMSWVHHYLMHTRGLTTGDSSFYLERDERLIMRCDELWIAGPPVLSAGVRFEIKVAEREGIPIKFMEGWDDPSLPSKSAL